MQTLIFYLGSLLSVEMYFFSNPSVLCCSTMWYNGTVIAARKLRIAYNISLRRLFGIPKYNSANASEMFVQLNTCPPHHLLLFCSCEPTIWKNFLRIIDIYKN